jgi:hypothetical protein
MSTLNGKSVASTYDQVVKRQDSYSATGNQIEIMDDSGVIKTTPLYLDSVNSRVGIGTASPASKLEVTGDVTVSTGNLVIGTHDKGIDFSANTDDYGTPASGAEVLDDYEEGTVTSPLKFGNTYVAPSNSQYFYTKIGRVVTVQFYLDTGGADVGVSGNIAVKLPFATTEDTGRGIYKTISYQGAAWAERVMYLTYGASDIVVNDSNNNAVSTTSNTERVWISGSIIYQVI